MNGKFIATEPLNHPGEAGEKLVWEAIKSVFANRDCLGYWRYPIFSQKGKFRKEPDVLIADLELGLIVIEVKSITSEQIVNINGHRWEYQNYYASFGNPYQQAENQLFALLDYSQNEPSLHKQIVGRVLLALPYISEQQWQARGFHQLPTNPPILFQEGLQSAEFIYQLIKKTPPVTQGNPLTKHQWQLLLSLLSGKPVFCQPSYRLLASPQSRGKILEKLRSRFSDFDLQQEKIGKQIPPGLQRIRGIAGSGKTVLLCQKAALMHLKHPDWKIALVFFSRSLYHPIIKQLDQWLNYFSQEQQNYNPQNPYLKVLHAWGGKQQPGLYSTLCKLAGVNYLTVNDTESKQPNEALAEACCHLLSEAAIPQVFDAILIDEGQDLIVDNFKFGDKQPFYWLAYQALRSANPLYPQQRRLIWAYDEAQSLESLKIPTASEIFGEELGHLVTGNHDDGIKKSEIMRCCYRTPHLIITAAHALGMGLLRPGEMLTGITRKEEWEAIGYEVQGNFISGQKIILKRPHKNSPNPISDLWQGSVIEFNSYFSRQQELTILANCIKHNLRHDGLRPSQEILIIILGDFLDAAKLENYVANFLIKQGIDIFIPSANDCNILKPSKENYNPNKFWHEGAITISRIHRAKGQEADIVYIVGLDNIAKEEGNITLRNQLLIALTRAKAWVNLSGIGSYPLYEEIQRVLESGDTFRFTFRRSPQREINATDAGDFLKRYALGGRNFQNIDLSNADLAGVNLSNANLIGANLTSANLHNAQLDNVKLIAADLSQANLSRANLKKAKLMGAILRGANLSQANLMGADLSNIDLAGADLTGTRFLIQ